MTASLGPDRALDIGRLQLSMRAEKSPVSVDEDLRIEDRVPALDPLRDTQDDGHFLPATECHDWPQFTAVPADGDALRDILCQHASLLQRGITFGEVLRLLESSVTGSLEVSYACRIPRNEGLWKDQQIDRAL